MENKIYIYKDCISLEDTKIIIDFINQNDELGFYGRNKRRYTIPLGTRPFVGTEEKKDEILKIKLKDFPDEVRDALSRVMNNTVNLIEEAFSDPGLHVANMFIAKQLSGGTVELHSDSGYNFDQHLVYSAVLYLNEIEDGDLCFPELGFCYHPLASEMIVFESKRNNSSHEVTSISSDRYSLPMFLSKDPNCYIE